ncbi:MAG: hypothetical protein AAB217_00645 [Chloroflexota bacterium]
MPSGEPEERYNFANESREASLALLPGGPEMLRACPERNRRVVRHDRWGYALTASTNNGGSCLVMPSGGPEERYNFANESREASLAVLSGGPEMLRACPERNRRVVRHDLRG